MKSDVHPESCQEIFAQLSDYLNLELPPDACAHIDQHLAGCAPCIEFVNSLRKTVQLCRQYQPAELPGELGAQAREQLLGAYKAMLTARR